LVGRGALPKLAELCLCEIGLGNEGLAPLVNAELPSLRSLDLSINDLSADGISLLERASWLSNLVTLSFGCDELGDEGVSRLSGCAQLARLEQLSLDYMTLGARGIQALAASPFLTGLKTLSLSNTQMTTAAAQALATASWPVLEHLNLEENAVDAEGLDSL